MRRSDEPIEPDPPAERLTKHELVTVVARLGETSLPPLLEVALERYVARNPDGLTNLLRCLISDERTPVCTRLARLLGDETSPEADGVPANDRGVFRRRGDHWEIEFDGRPILLRHAKGLAYLAELLARPHERIWSRDLVARGGKRVAPDQARILVTKAIKSVLDRLGMQHPDLQAYLAVTIRRGKFCAYTPDPRAPMRWIV